MSEYLPGLVSLTVKSTTDTLVVGTLNDIPVSLPLSSGITLPTALAAPVEAGMIFAPAALPALQSLPPLDGPSTVSWLIVTAWTVVMSPSAMPQLSWTTLATGARQLVVHEALETTFMLEAYFCWLTPMTKIGTSSLGGAEMMTFLAPP